MNLVSILRALPLLAIFVLITWSSALSQQGPQTLYLKNGKQINCDQVWQEGDDVFIVPPGKRFAISYEKNEIDLQRSSVRIPEKTSPPTVTRPTADVLVVPPKGEGSILRIYHHEYSLAPKSPPPQAKATTSEKPYNPTPAGNARDVMEPRDVGGTIPPNTPINYGAGNNPSGSGMMENKRLPDPQNQREPNQKNEQEYQQKLKEYDAAKRQVEEYNKQVEEHNAKIRKSERMERHREYINRSNEAFEAYNNKNKPISRDSGINPILKESFPDQMYREEDKLHGRQGTNPILKESFPDQMQRQGSAVRGGGTNPVLKESFPNQMQRPENADRSGRVGGRPK
jgi:hypothetical protein